MPWFRKNKKAATVFDAVAEDKLELLKALVEGGNNPSDLDEFGRTILHYVGLRGYLDFARYLVVELGLDVNAKDKNGWTPLHFACQEQQVAMVEYLLGKLAEIDVQDANGNTPLSNAVFNYRGNQALIPLLLKCGANPEMKNFHGVSPQELAYSISNYDSRKFFQDPSGKDSVSVK